MWCPAWLDARNRRMNRIRLKTSAMLAVLIAGCAAHPDPIIDTKGVDPDALAQDWQE